MAAAVITSWGRLWREAHDLHAPASRFDPLPPAAAGVTLLPYGNGRSYGDSCLNPGGVLIKGRALDRFIAFDPQSGRLACEAGVLLDDILRLVVPQGWFLPVTPGTRFVTVGGAIANDVHGKNHHVTGTFGRHVLGLELLRSDGQRLQCSPATNADWLAATIGGLGLTGFVTRAELQLRRIGGPWIDAETIRYDSLEQFFALCDASDRDYEYTVAWVDCAGRGRHLGRGHFMRGNHAPAGSDGGAYAPGRWRVPVEPPVSLVSATSIRVMNTLYYWRQPQRHQRAVSHYEPFFYPLDGILDWNRMYGPRGFYQYQCVIPHAAGEPAMRALLQAIAASGMGSFLAVLKRCGEVASPGLLSFPLPGVSLALDFPERGESLQRLFARLDRIVAEAGGRLYPAKDARMPGWLFRQGFPQWESFNHFVDPRISSAFWRRVMEGA